MKKTPLLMVTAVGITLTLVVAVGVTVTGAAGHAASTHGAMIRTNSQERLTP